MSDYRAIKIVPENTARSWWGADLFIWHFPLLKTLAAIGFVGWFV